MTTEPPQAAGVPLAMRLLLVLMTLLVVAMLASIVFYQSWQHSDEQQAHIGRQLRAAQLHYLTIEQHYASDRDTHRQMIADVDGEIAREQARPHPDPEQLDILNAFRARYHNELDQIEEHYQQPLTESAARVEELSQALDAVLEERP